MMLVGITGGIGSGKSVVCNIFKKWGVPIYEADQAAKNLYNTDQYLKKSIIELFGNDIYDSEKLNKKKLAEIIFNDSEKLDLVNQLVHPAVIRDFKRFIALNPSPFILHEAAILFESGVYKMMDKIINISSPIEIRVERVIERDNITKNEVLKRIDKQWTDEQRNNHSDFIIVNDDIQAIIPQAKNIYHILSTLCNSEPS